MSGAEHAYATSPVPPEAGDAASPPWWRRPVVLGAPAIVAVSTIVVAIRFRPDGPAVRRSPGRGVTPTFAVADLVVERALDQAQNLVFHLESDLRSLDAADGWGRWTGTPIGRAAVDWRKAESEQERYAALARNAGRKERRRLQDHASEAADREARLREHVERLATPERTRLKAALSTPRRPSPRSRLSTRLTATSW